MEFDAHHIVHRISGPVSVYYLKPPAQRPELPLVLLFGDVHESEKNLCDACTCEDDSKECCRRIDDPLFLKQFDAIAEHYPVDFFTESSPQQLHADPNAGILFYRLVDQTVKGCYDVPSRSKPVYTEKCPTQFIRWHHADARDVKHKVEGYLSYLVEYTKHFHPTRILYIDSFIPRVKNTNHYLRDKTIQYIRDYLGILRKDIPREEKIHAMVDQLIDFLEEHAPLRKSAILKQHVKLQHVNLQSMDVWKSYLIQRMIEHKQLEESFDTIQRYAATTPIDPQRLYERLMDLYISGMQFAGSSIKAMRGISYPDDLAEYADIMGEINQAIYGITLIFHSLLLDVYMLMRMFGTPKDNNSSLLAVGYFGNQHVVHIVSALQKAPFDYVLQYVSPYDGDGLNIHDASRCITLPGSAIPLVRDVEQLAQQRYGNAGRPEKYLNVLQRERAGRQQQQQQGGYRRRTRHRRAKRRGCRKTRVKQ